MKESKKGYMEEFGGSQGKGEMIYYNLKNERNLKIRLDQQHIHILICKYKHKPFIL